MNWNIGFKRITFILSIACAIWAGLYMYKRAGNDLDNSKRALSREIDSFTTHIPGYVERVRELQDSIRSDKRILFIAPEIGAFLGFCSVWAVYAMMRWISLGFCKYKEKDGQKANNR